METLKFEVEVIQTPQFKHRLICSNGKSSGWASYIMPTCLEGMVGITPYFHSGSSVEIVTVEKYCELTCIGEDQ